MLSPPFALRWSQGLVSISSLLVVVIVRPVVFVSLLVVIISALAVNFVAVCCIFCSKQSFLFQWDRRIHLVQFRKECRTGCWNSSRENLALTGDLACSVIIGKS